MSNQNLQRDLMACKSLKAMIDLMFSRYEVDFQLSFVQKTIFATGLLSVANMLKGYEKKEQDLGVQEQDETIDITPKNAKSKK
jgi:hypothetical protein